MRFRNFPAVFALALLSAAIAFPFLPSLRVDAKTFVLEVYLESTKAGHTQVYWDDGTGMAEGNSSIAAVPAHAPPSVYRLPIPLGVYSWVRFDPIDNDGTVVIGSARILDGVGRTVRTIDLHDFSGLNQIESLNAKDGRLEIKVVPGGGDPQLRLQFDPSLRIRYAVKTVAADWAKHGAVVFALLAAILMVIGQAKTLREKGVALARSLYGRPGWAVAGVSLFAVTLSAYPVVFGGKSYVAPNMLDARLLYDGTPTLPGYNTDFVTDEKGSDIGAVFWQHIPFSKIEHRAVFHDHEWPVWDRYNSCGSPLLGQGQSLFGSPIHFFLLAADGAAWAWDCDYLVEKWLFALGLGLLVLTVSARTSAALIVSLAAPFFGFFIYRFNHPAFFSLCAAPWPLYCWIRIARSQSVRSATLWACGLILADTALMNSGTVKEAYMLLFAMNFSGLVVMLSAAGPWRSALRRLAVVTWASVVFLMINAPVWLTFLQTLRGSYTSYDAASAFQIQPSLLIGFFDEAFYRPLTPGGNVFNPSVNFLILAGLIYFLTTLRLHFKNRTVMALAVSSLVPLSLAFGLVPPTWIEQLPLLRNVAHIDNCFSCALVILWSVVAGSGFSAAADRLGKDAGKSDLAIAGLLLFALAFLYVAFGQVVHRVVLASQPTFSPRGMGEGMRLDQFVGIYLGALVAALAGLGALARHCLRKHTLTGGAALGFILCVSILLWRGTLQPQSVAFQEHALAPGLRPDFAAASAAIRRMREGQASKPSRGVGLEASFFPGWTAVYGLEGISGPDALMNPYYRELTGLSPLSRIWDWRLNLSKDAVAAARPFLDFLNVGYYFSRPDNGPLGSGLVLDGRDDLDTYESPTAWPRAFYTDRLAVYDGPADLVRLILKGDGKPFAAIQTRDFDGASYQGVSPDLVGRTSSPAGQYGFTERSTSFALHASGPGVIVLSEAYWPGQSHATLNGTAAKIIRINHAFQGLIVGAPGDYRVTFTYGPSAFGDFLAIGAAGMALLVISVAAVLRSKRVQARFEPW